MNNGVVMDRESKVSMGDDDGEQSWRRKERKGDWSWRRRGFCVEGDDYYARWGLQLAGQPTLGDRAR